MKIRDFLKEHFEKRLEKAACLVVYDPEKRYREVVLDLDGAACRVIDGSLSTILAREEAMEAWRRLAASSDALQFMVIYLPGAKPGTVVERQRNPYEAFAIGGAVFPYDDGDTYQALCRMAKPDFHPQVDALFAAGIPDFDTVDAVDGGSNWPKLRSLLKAESAAEILMAILSPSERQRSALEEDEAWPAEVRQFASTVLGLRIKTKSHKWQPIQQELARYVLFSEFVLDLPEELPSELKDVPRAQEAYKDLIYKKMCDGLRTSEHHQTTYMELAGKVVLDLNLEELLGHVHDFGRRDTLAFEERSFLKRFVEKVERGALGEARKISQLRLGSIWAREGERQLLWTIVERALDLISTLEALKPEWKSQATSLTSIFSFYTEHLRLLDTHHRVFEQAVDDAYGELGIVSELVEKARQRYLKFSEEVQSVFVERVEEEGWPPGGHLRQTQVFEKSLAQSLQDRERTALLLVDALRFELAAELKSHLAGTFQVEFHAVTAQLPTVPRVGMAALMPDADGSLRLVRKNGDIIPTVQGQEIKDPSDRLKYIQTLYGDRCAMVGLDQLLKKKKLQIPDTVHLLIIKTQDIDELGTFLARDAAWMIPGVLKKIPAAMSKLKDLHFEHVVIASDHGFILLEEQAGDVVPKPAGDWVQVKGRYLLGSGSGTPGTVALDAAHSGIRGEVDTLVVPRSFGTFSRSSPYFHGGLSLQECVLPVMCVTVMKKGGRERRPPKLRLSYKGGATDSVTTRRPMIEVALYQEQMDGFGAKELELQLEAHAKGKVVGEAASCSYLDPSTNTITIQLGQAIKVPLRMDEDYEGSFEVRAIDPRTQANHATLKLKTNYMDVK